MNEKSVKVEIRGLTVVLEPDDPRVKALEDLVFSEQFEVPPPVRRFWDALEPLDRRELLLLSEGEKTPLELEKALGGEPGSLMGRHRRIARLAAQEGVELELKAKGHGRENRRFTISPELAVHIKRVARLPSLF